MHITVFGAGGMVGQMVVNIALARGHSVTASVHSSNPFDELPGLNVLIGDIYNADDVAQAIRGSQAVISTLGSWHTKHKNVLTSAMQAIIPAMQTEGMSRIITVTGSGALYSGDKPRLIDKLGRFPLTIIAPKILRDGEQHLELLAASGLNWTSLRSPIMTRGKGAGYALRTQLATGVSFVPARAVATCLVDQLESADFLGQAPVIYRR